MIEVQIKKALIKLAQEYDDEIEDWYDEVEDILSQSTNRWLAGYLRAELDNAEDIEEQKEIILGFDSWNEDLWKGKFK